jgi:diguanylate cyclase (GGDEF)-like protein
MSSDDPAPHPSDPTGASAGQAVTHGELERRARAAWELRRRDPDTALREAETLRDDAVAAGDDHVLGLALTVEGACHLAHNDFPAAVRALLEALVLLDGGPEADLARALSEAGNLDVMTGDRGSGMELLFDALERFERLGDTTGQADTLNRIGVAFFSHGDLDEAQDAYERSLALRGDAPDDVVARAGVRNNLAKVLTERGEHDAALVHLAQARRGFERADEPRGLAMTIHNEATIHELRGDTDGAREQLRSAIELYDGAGHPHGAVEARTQLGRLLVRTGDDEVALDLLRRAHNDAELLGLGRGCTPAAEAIAELFERRGDDTEALTWLRHVLQVERRSHDEDSEQRLRTLQVRFQVERLERDSVTDGLTGLTNRRGLDRALKAATDRALREDTDLALLLLDLDDFKRVNDDFSHSVGDDVLREVASILGDVTRRADVCARYGGEEFVVLLPTARLERATAVAEELRRRVADQEWSRIATGLTVTTSVGVSLLSRSGDARALLGAADRALYDAKRSGKDQVRTAS